MALTSVETIALIFSLLILVKLIVVFINKKSWYDNVAKPVYSNPKVSGFIILILALIIFYYLLNELTIVQIIVVIAFTTLLMGLGFLSHSKELTPLITKSYGKSMSLSQIIYVLVWLALTIWVLYEILIV